MSELFDGILIFGSLVMAARAFYLDVFRHDRTNAAFLLAISALWLAGSR